MKYENLVACLRYIAGICDGDNHVNKVIGSQQDAVSYLLSYEL